jgi:hypothetical protein
VSPAREQSSWTVFGFVDFSALFPHKPGPNS